MDHIAGEWGPVVNSVAGAWDWLCRLQLPPMRAINK